MLEKKNFILRDVDEKDAGLGGLDIFSMEFEGENATPAETPAEPTPAEEPSKEEETPAVAVTEEPASVPEAAPAPEPKVEPTPAPAPASPSAPSSDELLANAMKVIENLTKAQAAPKAEPASKAAEMDDEDAKIFKAREFSDYTFNINPKLYNALFSPDATEDERMGALQGFASGIATTVHNNILNSLGKWTRDNFSAIPRAVNYLIEKREASQNSVKSIRDDFYASFPELNKPELLPLIKATIQSVQRETNAQAWTPQVKNLVGSRVKNLLNAYAVTANPASIPAAPKTIKTTATPPAVKPQSLDPNSSDAILSIFDTDF